MNERNWSIQYPFIKLLKWMEILVLVYFRFTMFYVVVRPLLFKFIVFPGCVYVCKFGSVWLDPANYFV